MALGQKGAGPGRAGAAQGGSGIESQGDEPGRSANPDRLRQLIDRGEGGDKIDYPDPAAAPLGTDDEAGGHPITQEQLDIAMKAEIRSSGGPAPAQSGRQENGPPNLRFVLVLVLIGVVLIAVTAAMT